MSRNLLLDTQTPYAWHTSDTNSVSDISVPGKFVQSGSAAYSNAYLWIQERTCVPDASRNLHKMDEWLTLSLDVKVSGRTAGKVYTTYDLRQTGSNPQKDMAAVDISSHTEWARTSIPVKVDLVKNEAQIVSLFVIYCRDCNQGTTVEWRNMKLEVGDTGSEWTPAPEEVLCQRLEESDVEPGAISVGNTVIAGNTLASMKSDGSWLTTRVRTKNIIPLMGKKAFYVGFSANLVCFPIYFDASDLSVAAPCDAHSTDDVFVAPQGAVGVELVFRKSDSSAITPADVTNVTGGGVLYGHVS